MLRKSENNKSRAPKFKKKSVDLDKFIKEIYVDNGLAYISCNVAKYTNVIDRLSVEGYEWLDWHFTRFVEENAASIPTEYPIVLEICGCKFTKQQQEAIEGTVSDYYALKLGDAQAEYKRNQKRLAFLAVVAAIAAALVALMSMFPVIKSAVFSEMVFVLFWIAVWESFDYAVFEKKDLLEQKIKAAQLASMKVSFKEKFTDDPLKPSEESTIIKEAMSDEELIPSDEWD